MDDGSSTLERDKCSLELSMLGSEGLDLPAGQDDPSLKRLDTLIVKVCLFIYMDARDVWFFGWCVLHSLGERREGGYDPSEEIFA